MQRIGLISDTHGLLRPEVLDYLRGSSLIIHAGDIGSPEVLAQLSQLAPVTAVRGNNDKGVWAAAIPDTELIKVEETYIYVLHNLADLDIDPQATSVGAVISGHTHQPLVDERSVVLFVNPGSSGPRRFRSPVSAGEIIVQGKRLSARIITLTPNAA